MPLATVPDVNASLLDWAQWYAAQGWPVLPSHTPNGAVCSCPKGANCASPGKHPRVTTWKDASTNQQTIAQWWQKWPNANIQLMTGQAFCVLDVDHRHDGHNTLKALEKQQGFLPPTPQVFSGSGSDHYYFALPPGGCTSADSIAPGLDFKCFQAMIVAPPSLHSSGKRYLWDTYVSLDAFDLAPVPPWILNLVTAKRAPRSSNGITPGTMISEGGRYEYLIAFAGRLRYSGLDEEQIFQGLQIANQNCEPPEEEKALRDYARWAGRKEAAPPEVLDPPSIIVTPAPVGTFPSVNGIPPPSTPFPWNVPTPVVTRAPLQFTDLADMLERTYPIPQWLIDTLIPEGLTFFVGSPKSSKTYLAYSLALSLAYEAQRGGRWLDHYEVILPGPVVYITLEDDEADTRWRIAELAPWLTTSARDRMIFVHGFELPSLSEGLIDALRDEVIAQYHPALIVLDPISYLYGSTKKGSDQFAEIKQMLLPLRWLGKMHHCAILGVDHRRKKNADDVDIFETQYGSNAKTAIADSLIMIVRDDTEVTIHARVRKAGDQTITLGFEFAQDSTAQWTWKGAVGGLVGQGQYGDLRQKVLNALSGSTIPLSVQDILAGLNMPDSRQTRQTVYTILFRAQKSHEVQKTTRGQYVWAGGN